MVKLPLFRGNEEKVIPIYAYNDDGTGMMAGVGIIKLI